MDIGILAVSKPRNGLLNVPLGEELIFSECDSVRFWLELCQLVLCQLSLRKG